MITITVKIIDRNMIKHNLIAGTIYISTLCAHNLRLNTRGFYLAHSVT
jgi:hypothetical protein